MTPFTQRYFYEGDPPRKSWKRRLGKLVSFLSTLFVSALFHTLLLMILAMFVYRALSPPGEKISSLLVTETAPQTQPEPAEMDLEPLPVEVPPEKTEPLSVQDFLPELPEKLLPVVKEDPPAKPMLQETVDFSEQIAEPVEGISNPGGGESRTLVQSFAGRSGEMRAKLVKQNGGTPESELAVEEGLKWLARHQRSDGGWSFDHVCPNCDQTCKGIGSHKEWTAGATAMAVMCFLGAGHTQEKGDYQNEVRAGLRYLLGQRGGTRAGDDYTKGRSPGMYVQGLVGIALAEAYAMTRDDFLRPPAIAALDFIANAQDPNGGGWRYLPRQGGDTSVVGWQVMALTSGRVAGLGDWRPQRGMTMKFLDYVQSQNGSCYGYTGPNYRAKPSTTAIGLLCRMYLGWNNRVALQQGVQYLSQTGPSPNEMYYNYYATQVLHHWGGPHWIKWNEKMRNQLVSTQTRYGHGKGSWDTKYGHYSHAGGRLYVTCLSILTLEVYYRHLPLYQEKSVGGRQP